MTCGERLKMVHEGRKDQCLFYTDECLDVTHTHMKCFSIPLTPVTS